MPILTTRRAGGTAAIGAIALALAACSDSDGGQVEEGADGTAQQGAQAAVLASYESLDGESYQMDSHMTIDGLDFMDMTMQVEGDSSRATQDIYMSAIMEAMGEDFSGDPEMEEMMESMFADAHSEAIIVDDVLYMQFSGGGIYEALTEEFGEGAWFTLDLADDSEIGQIYQQVGSFDLREQTEMMLNELTDVEEVEDGVYTGTLEADSEAMRTLMNSTGGTANGAQLVDDTEVTITVDDDGLLETVEMTLPEIEGMTIHSVSEVVEIGAAYDIGAPESDNIHSFDEFAGSLQ